MAEDWVAAGEAVTERMAELRMFQNELAARSKVSSATIRLIQHHDGRHRHSLRTLEAISKALDWPPQYLENVLYGRPQQVTADATLESRLDSLEQLLRKINVVFEQRLGSVVDVIYNSDSKVDVTIEIKHAGPDR